MGAINRNIAEQDQLNAHDWGRKDYQGDLLNAIEKRKDALNDLDTAGHIYWAQFEELVKSINP